MTKSKSRASIHFNFSIALVATLAGSFLFQQSEFDVHGHGGKHLNRWNRSAVKSILQGWGQAGHIHNGGKPSLPIQVSWAVDESSGQADASSIEVESDQFLSAVTVEAKRISQSGEVLAQANWSRSTVESGELLRFDVRSLGELLAGQGESLVVSIQGLDQSGAQQSRVLELRPEGYRHPLFERVIASDPKELHSAPIPQQSAVTEKGRADFDRRSLSGELSLPALTRDSEGLIVESFQAVQE